MKSQAVDLSHYFLAAGLPVPVAEYKFHPERKFRFDYAWLPYMVCLEIEGATWTNGRHVRGRGYAADCEKYNLAGILGWLVIRATTEQVQSGEAFQWVRDAILSRAEKMDDGK